jgi:hypothetical protein
MMPYGCVLALIGRQTIRLSSSLYSGGHSGHKMAMAAE